MKKKKNVKRNDTAWKQVLEELFEEFLALCWPKLHCLIDWNKKYISLEQELLAIDISYGKHNLTDKLFRIWFKDSEEEQWLLVHVEVQGRSEEIFAKRMFTYVTKLCSKYERSVISCAILVDPSPTWFPKPFTLSIAGFKHQLDYFKIKILDFQKKIEELEKSSNVFAKVILIQLKVLKLKNIQEAKKKLLTKLMLTKELYRLGYTRDKIIILYNFIDWLIALPKELSLKYNDDMAKFEKENSVAYISTAERIGIEKGIAQGLTQGITQGLAQGITQGLVQGMDKGLEKIQQLVLSLIEQKFNSIPEEYKQQIFSIKEEELLYLVKELNNAKTIEDLFVKT